MYSNYIINCNNTNNKNNNYNNNKLMQYIAINQLCITF